MHWRDATQGLVETRAAQMADLSAPCCKGVRELAQQTDLIIVLGGDGTMLGAARDLAGSGSRVLGINIGGLGVPIQTRGDEVAELQRHLRILLEGVEDIALIVLADVVNLNAFLRGSGRDLWIVREEVVQAFEHL